MFIVNLIVCLPEIKRVMQGGRGKLHAHIIGDIIKRHQVFAVHILYRHAESHIRMLHLHQCFQCLISSVETVRNASDRVIGLLQSFDADPDADFWKLLTQSDDPVGKITVGGYDNPVRFLI